MAFIEPTDAEIREMLLGRRNFISQPLHMPLNYFDTTQLPNNKLPIHLSIAAT